MTNSELLRATHITNRRTIQNEHLGKDLVEAGLNPEWDVYDYGFSVEGYVAPEDIQAGTRDYPHPVCTSCPLYNNGKYPIEGNNIGCTGVQDGSTTDTNGKVTASATISILEFAPNTVKQGNCGVQVDTAKASGKQVSISKKWGLF